MFLSLAPTISFIIQAERYRLKYGDSLPKNDFAIKRGKYDGQKERSNLRARIFGLLSRIFNILLIVMTLHIKHICIFPAEFHQFIMRSAFNDSAVFKINNAIAKTS